MKKQAIVVHSGGLDSSLCLKLAAREFGAESILSLSFNYGQRHAPEIIQAKKICDAWNIDHVILPIECLQEITESALIGCSIPILHENGKHANTLVLGRNGLMARLAAIHAQYLGANCIFMGVLEIDGQHMGYRDCTRSYYDLKQQLLRLDLANPSFEIRTPLIFMTKKESLEVSHKLGILEFLLKETVSCYEGVIHQGCQHCPTCHIRNNAIAEFLSEYPDFKLPWQQ